MRRLGQGDLVPQFENPKGERNKGKFKNNMEIGYRYLYFNYVGSQLSLESNLPGVYSGIMFRF